MTFLTPGLKWKMGKKHSPHPIKAQDLKLLYKDRPLETRETLLYNPYPPNVATVCFLETRDRPDGFPMMDIETNQDIQEWAGPISYQDVKGKKMFLVDVLERNEVPDGSFFYNYTVVARIGKSYIQQVVNVPHAACTFVDRPYASDIHIKGAFRHVIGLPDTIFPQAWRDLR